MSDAVLLGLLGLAGGPLVLKVAEKMLGRGERQADELALFRKELREENQELRRALSECQQRCSEAYAKVSVLEARVKDLERHVGGVG